MTLNADQFWHLTDDPHFQPDPEHRPQLNSLMGDMLEPQRGIFVSKSPEYWMQAHGYERPYVAQIEGKITDPAGTVMHTGSENFMAPGARTKRVLTIDEYAREKFHEPGWVEDYHGEPWSMTRPLSEYHAENRRRFPPGYQGRPTTEMSGEELGDYEKQFKEWTERSR